MSSLLYRVGRLAVRGRWVVISAWLVLAVGGSVLAQVLGGTLSTAFEIPGTPSQAALDSLEQRFPQLSGASVRVVLVAASGSTITDQQGVVTQVCGDLASLAVVTVASCPYPMPATGTSPASDGDASQISDDGTMAFIALQLTIPSTSIDTATVDAVQGAAAPARNAGMQVAYAGLVATDSGGVDSTEVIGLAIAFVVLAITFGAVIAAGVPLVSAVTGVVVSSGAILIVAAFVPVSSTAPLLATMLGLAVGIDYALLIVSRHRTQMAAGLSARESIPVAIATAGTAVVFAGMTVIIALLGLSVAGIPFLSVMGLGAAAAVLVALTVAVTLLPAILAVLGRLVRPRARRTPRDPARVAGWVRAATRIPALTIGAVVGVLVLVALPALGLRLTLPDAGYDPPGSPPRVAYDLLAEGFGPGFNGPLLVTADISGTLDVQDALTALDGAFSGIPDVVAVSAATPNEALDLAVLTVTPASSPSSDSTTELVRTLRANAPAFEEANGFTYAVTGQTALAIDVSERLSAALVPFGIVVVGLCLVLLTIMFRSIAVPLSATLGYLLSVGAALGATTAVFVWGWGASVVGVGTVGPVVSFLPILVMAVLFGLAMDYHVFLVSRMREHYAAGGEAHAAVRTGFSASARVVTAAALIMFSVFFSFVPGGDATIQPLAFALAVGVLVDAFIVRMTFIPAVMSLLGDRAWWLPRRIAALLPNADIEGEAVERMRAQRAWRAALTDRPEAADGIVGHDLVIAGLPGPDIVVPRGGLLVIEGDDAFSGLLCAALAGRVAQVEGDLTVHGLLIPFERSALALRAAYVPARAEVADGTTLAESVRRGLRADGIRLRRQRVALGRAAAAFREIGEVVAGPAVRRITPHTPLGDLSDGERWVADVAVAVASGLDLVAIDLGARASSPDLARLISAATDAGTTLVLAGVGQNTVPAGGRPVVRVVPAPEPVTASAVASDPGVAGPRAVEQGGAP